MLLLDSFSLHAFLMNYRLQQSDLVHKELNLVHVLRSDALLVTTKLGVTAEMRLAQVRGALCCAVSIMVLLDRQDLVSKLLTHPLVSSKPVVATGARLHLSFKGLRTQRSLALFNGAQLPLQVIQQLWSDLCVDELQSLLLQLLLAVSACCQVHDPCELVCLDRVLFL